MKKKIRRCRTCHFAPCRCEDLAGNQMAMGQSAAGWPFYSDALAVHPSQIKDAVKFYKSRGISVEFSKDGRPKMNDRNHRARILRARGLFDRNAGYGDTSPGYAERDGLPQRPMEGPMTSMGF
jgi:hypothetical protein